MFRTRMSDYCLFGAGLIVGMAMLAGGCMLRHEMNAERLRGRAADATAALAAQAGNRIRLMGRKLARKMR